MFGFQIFAHKSILVPSFGAVLIGSHIASVLSQIIQVNDEPEPTAAQQRAQMGKKSVLDDFEQMCKAEGFDPYVDLPADG